MRQLGLPCCTFTTTSPAAAGWLQKATATLEGSEQPGWGWAVKLLPQMEQDGLFQTIAFDKPIFDPSDPRRHAEVRSALLPEFLCPSDVTGPSLKTRGCS